MYSNMESYKSYEVPFDEKVDDIAYDKLGDDDERISNIVEYL